MAEYTDTQRLTWLQSKGCVEIEDAYMGPVTIEQSGQRLGRGANLRAAIDAGMRKERVARAKPTLESMAREARLEQDPELRDG